MGNGLTVLAHAPDSCWPRHSPAARVVSAASAAVLHTGQSASEIPVML